MTSKSRKWLRFTDTDRQWNEFWTLGRKTEKHEIQMLSCDGELKADEYWMSAETSWIHDIARGRRDIAGDSVQGFEGQVASLNHMELFEQFVLFHM